MEEDERIYLCFEGIETPKKETRQSFQMQDVAGRSPVRRTKAPTTGFHEVRIEGNNDGTTQP